MKILFIKEMYTALPEDFNGTFLDAIKYSINKMEDKDSKMFTDKFGINDNSKFNLGEYESIDELYSELSKSENVGKIEFGGFEIKDVE